MAVYMNYAIRLTGISAPELSNILPQIHFCNIPHVLLA